MNKTCPKCYSENIFFSKKRQMYVCEDCDYEFLEEFVPQKIFISYGHDKNTPLVEKIYDALMRRGHNPWIDYSEIKCGDEWRTKIRDGIKESGHFIACLSRHSVRVPGVCLDEIAIAISQKSCKINSILLEAVSAPNSISNIQWLDMHDWEQYYQKGEKIWNNWFDEKVKQLYQSIESDENINYAGEIRNLSDLLNPVSMDIKIKLLLRDEIVGRKWLLNIVKDFVAHDDKQLLWLVGLPGTGKSAFSAILSNYLENCCAVYFCQWDKLETLKSKNIIRTLAFQLACNLADYRLALLECLKNINFGDLTTEDLLEQILIAPLNSLIDGNRGTVCVVIDALDEIDEENASIINTLSRMLSSFPKWIKFIFTCRPEARIINCMDEFTSEIYKIEGTENYDDIKRFILPKVNNSVKLAEAVARKSGESFILAKEYVKILDKNDFDLQCLEKVGNGIADIYYQSFSRLFTNCDYYQYSKLIGVIMCARESINVELAKQILDVTQCEIDLMLDKVSSFFIQIPYKRETVIQSYHKTLNDWLISTQAREFRVDIEQSEILMANFFLNKLSDNNFTPSSYVVKYALSHLKKSGLYDKQTDEIKKQIFKRLAEGAKDFGYAEIEKDILKKWGRLCPTDDIDYLLALLEYSYRLQVENIPNICARLRKVAEKEQNELVKFSINNRIATALFYIGNDKQALQIMLNEKNSHPREFWTEEVESEYNHTISLIAHDLDRSEEVLEASLQSVAFYQEEGRHYLSVVCNINAMDAYMALGRLEQAEAIATRIKKDLEVRYYVHADDIFHICYGNLLLTEGRIMEAFMEYEKGIELAKDIQKWDYLYGRIWYARALCEFFDPTAASLLKSLAEEAKNAGYQYLYSLSMVFLAYTYHYQNLACDVDEYNNLIKAITLIGLPAHIATVLIIGLKKGIVNKNKISDIVENLMLCQGMKGCSDIVTTLLEYQELLSPEERFQVQSWKKQYLDPMLNYREAATNSLVGDLPENPLVPGCACEKCQNKCCYDGVYLRNDEIAKIQQFVDKNASYFSFLPEQYIVDGDWESLKQYQKTATKSFNYTCVDFPSHFTQTCCVFALTDGCALQKCAVEQFMNPWKYKPMACWSFPIRGCRNNKLIPPPASQEEDENNLGPNYPGYAWFLPCVNGSKVIPWKKYYKKEIEYYKLLGLWK